MTEPRARATRVAHERAGAATTNAPLTLSGASRGRPMTAHQAARRSRGSMRVESRKRGRVRSPQPGLRCPISHKARQVTVKRQRRCRASSKRRAAQIGRRTRGGRVASNRPSLLDVVRVTCIGRPNRRAEPAAYVAEALYPEAVHPSVKESRTGYKARLVSHMDSQSSRAHQPSRSCDAHVPTAPAGDQRAFRGQRASISR